MSILQNINDAGPSIKTNERQEQNPKYLRKENLSNVVGDKQTRENVNEKQLKNVSYSNKVQQKNGNYLRNRSVTEYFFMLVMFSSVSQVIGE